ncbi:mammalian cell entry protein [Mycobacterium sp. ITM-2016-00318]|uniref:mammalian cell entry protein n=1 Tax=Mycobacterium sp. ITM-2016-00318 TaxID=2099693 RepID=UPI000CF8AB5D|nr:mammalian cell entry protein [Mycobacterium sp. ITM-2016-00318]WNG93051.1 mammalian cell entry protein [Mycobacterium sp. ITM-2016-00318]
MEDQPTDSGDLTTDAAAAPSAPAPRGRHRMPIGKKLRATKPEAEASAPVDDEVQVEESADPVELPAPSVEETPAEETPTKKGRRRGFLRRGKDQPAAVPVEEKADEPVDAVAPAEETVGETAEPVDADDEAAEPEEPAEGEIAAEETVLVPHRPAGKRMKIVAAAAAVLFVAGGAFLGATAQPVIANNALVETKLNIARTAANAITTLWSYTPENMDSLGERSARYLTGDFAFQYKKFIDSIVATNKQAQVTNTTSVLGTAVESVTSTDASAVVYTNSIATSPVSKNIPSLRYLSYRLEMKRDHTEWRITRMTTITTLDLTPQL